jgi:hypothetical protein
MRELLDDLLHLGDDVVLESAESREEKRFLTESTTDLPHTAPVPPVWLVFRGTPYNGTKLSNWPS